MEFKLKRYYKINRQDLAISALTKEEAMAFNHKDKIIDKVYYPVDILLNAEIKLKDLTKYIALTELYLVKRVKKDTKHPNTWERFLPFLPDILLTYKMRFVINKKKVTHDPTENVLFKRKGKNKVFYIPKRTLYYQDDQIKEIKNFDLGVIIAWDIKKKHLIKLKKEALTKEVMASYYLNKEIAKIYYPLLFNINNLSNVLSIDEVINQIFEEELLDLCNFRVNLTPMPPLPKEYKIILLFLQANINEIDAIEEEDMPKIIHQTFPIENFWESLYKNNGEGSGYYLPEKIYNIFYNKDKNKQ